LRVAGCGLRVAGCGLRVAKIQHSKFNIQNFFPISYLHSSALILPSLRLHSFHEQEVPSEQLAITMPHKSYFDQSHV
jgi:hypothetical protein